MAAEIVYYSYISLTLSPRVSGAAMALILRRSFRGFLYSSTKKNNHQLNGFIKCFSTLKDNNSLNISRISFIGGGKMAEAIINGILSKKLIEPKSIVVTDPNPERRQLFKKMSIQTTESNEKAVENAEVILMAIKPQALDMVANDIRAHLTKGALIISILAGSRISCLLSHLGDDTSIVRAMPNTPSMIGEGVTVWSHSSNVTEHQHELAKSILGSIGDEIYATDEHNLDMATALSGSGPAYFFLVAEAMIDAGVHMGFPRHVAQKLVQKTMLGSALYLNSSEKHPALLRNDITSPGGTTAAALYRAEKNGFRSVIADSIWAAYERCRELGSPTPVIRKRPRN